MDPSQIGQIVGSIGLTGVLAFANYMQWREGKAKEQEIARLNKERIDEQHALLALLAKPGGPDESKH